MKLKLALLGGLLLVGANAMACYTVYDSGNRVVYQGPLAPVDMSLPLHEALAQRFPRGVQMVFNQSANCQPVGLGQVPRPTGADVPPNTIRMERTNAPSSSSGPSPLFTDRLTAERAQLPHTQVAGDIVVVPPLAADRAMHAAVTVLPATTVAAAPAAPDTRSLGAGPARPSTARPKVVITEMRDPPLTVIETDGTRIITPQ
ncbi:hypothetical protein GCM10028796_54680 [Ramlibacter monticola]|uniref:DUF4124 domain-containing protein n=1 Tax=Ramlibacter monticola TaxID=1926872 RepID=A0A936Z7G9_9BURK|nr:hypothetical protein [Ramlibacter monticola]MBL0394814.1 hypothetical protein [Ramlibacter monticola]